VQKIAYELIESLGVQGQRHLVDGVLDRQFSITAFSTTLQTSTTYDEHRGRAVFRSGKSTTLRLQSDFTRFATLCCVGLFSIRARPDVGTA